MRKLLFAGAVMGLLSGCMGSDSDRETLSSNDPSETETEVSSAALDGDWRSPCVELDGHGWAQLTLSFTGENQAEQFNRLYSSASCSGDAQEEMVLDVLFEAGEEVELGSGGVAYRIEYLEREVRGEDALFPPGEDIYAVQGDQLYFGDPKEDAANEGVQSELNREFVYERL